MVSSIYESFESETFDINWEKMQSRGEKKWHMEDINSFDTFHVNALCRKLKIRFCFSDWNCNRGRFYRATVSQNEVLFPFQTLQLRICKGWGEKCSRLVLNCLTFIDTKIRGEIKTWILFTHTLHFLALSFLPWECLG